MSSRKQTVAQIAEALGLSTKTIDRWIKRGAPHDVTDGKTLMRVEEIRKWQASAGLDGKPGRPQVEDELSRAVSGSVDSSAASTADYKKRFAMARLAKEIALAQRVQFDLGVRKGEYVSASEVEHGRISRVAAVKAGLLSLPSKLALRCVGRTSNEIEAIARADVDALLTEFSRT